MAAPGAGSGTAPPVKARPEPSPNSELHESDGEALMAVHRGAPQPDPVCLYGLVGEVARGQRRNGNEPLCHCCQFHGLPVLCNGAQSLPSDRQHLAPRQAICPAHRAVWTWTQRGCAFTGPAHRPGLARAEQCPCTTDSPRWPIESRRPGRVDP